jgi:NitT/TauT family transport system substrate-binding protein
MSRIIPVFILALLAGVLGSPRADAQTPPTKVTFSLDFIVLGRHAPWYVALAKGYYKDEGLDVNIIPAQGTAQSIQALESNVAQFAFSDVAALVQARARGASTAEAVAVNYQKAPYAIFSLDPGANVTRPAQLKGLEVASGAGSFTPKIIQGFMKEKGLDPNSIKFTMVDGAARVGLLLSGKVPAIENFILAQPGIEKSLSPGSKLATLLLADDGLELYSNAILVRGDTIKANPAIVRGFVRASLRGWKEALANPGEAADLQLNYIKALNRDVIMSELGVIRGLAVTADTQAHGLGWMDPAKVQKSVDFVVQNIGIEGKAPAVNDVYTAAFLPQPPITP